MEKDDMRNNLSSEELADVLSNGNSRPRPEFKPGDTPYTQFGDETLNANVPWDRIVRELLDAPQYSVASLASEMHMPMRQVCRILKGNTQGLAFKEGAKLLALHCHCYPLQYVECNG